MRPLAKGRYQSVPGAYYGTPKEIWGFATSPRAAKPIDIAREFVVANAALFQLHPHMRDLKHQKTIASLGATHVILKQMHRGFRVHRGYVTVHLDARGRVYMAKNRSVPERLLPAEFVSNLDERAAAEKARRALPRSQRAAKLDDDTEQLWFPCKAKLEPAWKFRYMRERPREEWLIYVNARTGAILNKYDNAANRSGVGLVFDPSPVTALGSHDALVTLKQRPRRPPQDAYREVVLRDLDDTGGLSGKRVTTAPTARRVSSPDGRFFVRAGDLGFEEVMAYYHIDSAIRYLEKLGFRGRRAIFDEPVQVKVNGTREDNSWYSPGDRMLTFGSGWIDDAEDGETILHELGHAIQDAICPDFGQSAEAAAIGEGFGDYFAASFFESRKPQRYRASVMSWDGLLCGLDQGDDPPCLRRLDGRQTYRDFKPRGDEHDNGVIWSATLWAVREALGRDVADRIILESHFQLDGFTDMARAARAIVDADTNLFRGKHREALAKVFRRRAIGPL